MKLLLKYIKNYIKETILGPFFKLLEAGFELFVPLIIAKMIDEGIAQQNQTLIWLCALALGLLALIGCISAISAQYFSAKAAVGMSEEMRRDLFAHIESFGYTEIDQVGTSTLITRLTNDINQVQNGVNLFLRLFLRSPFIVFGSMIMAFTISPRLAIVFVITILILFLVVIFIMVVSIPLVKKVASLIERMTQLVSENLSGVRVIRAFHIEKEQAEEFETQNKNYYDASILVGKINAFLNPVTTLILNCAILILIYKGGFQVFEGSITQGQLVALVSYMSSILIELIKLVNLVLNLTKAIASASRIESIFNMQTSYLNQPEEISYEDNCVFHFEHVSFRYQNDQMDTIQDVSFCIPKNKRIGIIGGTGSGKSTLVHLMGRFYDASSGKILYKGVDISHVDLKKLHEEVVLVPQQAVLFKGTIAQNLRWGKKDASEAEMMEACRNAQMADFVEEKGLDYEIAQNGLNLSGGQRQRLTIARALVAKAEVLILDASSSALDYATEAALRKAIAQNYECTLITISQRVSSLMDCDMILVMDEGKLVGMGTHEELMKNCVIYQKISASQIREVEA